MTAIILAQVSSNTETEHVIDGQQRGTARSVGTLGKIGHATTWMLNEEKYMAKVHQIDEGKITI